MKGSILKVVGALCGVAVICVSSAAFAQGTGPKSNDTDEGRQENRRVQFNIIKQQKAGDTEVKVDNASKTGGVNPKPTKAPAP